MTKRFSERDRKAALPVWPEAEAETSRRSPLDAALDRIARALLRPTRARLPRRRPALDVLEPRLLLSGDPMAAGFAVAEDATLRVTEVQKETEDDAKADEKDTELRVQLIEGVDPAPASATVIAERRIEVTDEGRVVVASDGNDLSTLSINGDGGDNTLLLDQSVLSLAENLEIEVDLGAGGDTLTGPEKSEGLIWSLDDLSGGSAGGELAFAAPTGELDSADDPDYAIDTRETYAGGRDHLLGFAGVETLNLQGARDVLVERGIGASTWGVTWAEGIDANTATFVHSGGLDVTGVDGFQGAGDTTLDLSVETRAAGEAGADFNAEGGELRLYAAADTARDDPLLALDIRDVTTFTGTGGADEVRIAPGMTFNLGGGEDVAIGTEGLQGWRVAAGTGPDATEAHVTVAFYEEPEDSDAADDWIATGDSSGLTDRGATTLIGVDAIVGGDSGDALVVERTDAKAVFSGNRDAPRIALSYGGATFAATGIERLAATGGGVERLDLSALAGPLEVNFRQGTATGVEAISGFEAVVTGGADDVVVAAASTREITTGGGADTITLARFTGAATVSAGAGENDRLLGEANALSDVFTDTRAYESPFSDESAAPDDLDPDTTGLQTRDPLRSVFRVASLGDASGAGGVVTTRGYDGSTETQQGAEAAFLGRRAHRGAGRHR